MTWRNDEEKISTCSTFRNKKNHSFWQTFQTFLQFLRIYISPDKFSFLLLQDEETIAYFFTPLSTFQLEKKIQQHLKHVSFYFLLVHKNKVEIVWSIRKLLQVKKMYHFINENTKMMPNRQKVDVQKNDKSFAILMCCWKTLDYIESLFFPIVPAPIPCKAFGPDPVPCSVNNPSARFLSTLNIS